MHRISLLGGARRDHCRDLLRSLTTLRTLGRSEAHVQKVREDVTGTCHSSYLDNLRLLSGYLWEPIEWAAVGLQAETGHARGRLGAAG